MPAPTYVARAFQLDDGDPVLWVLTRGFADGVPISIGFPSTPSRDFQAWRRSVKLAGM